MIKIKNICNDVGVGAFYHSPTYSPTSHTLSYEPYIGEIQLKLNEVMNITEGTYTRLRSYLEDLRNHRIISFTDPVVEEVVVKEPKKYIEVVEEVKLEEKVEELKEVVEAEPTVEDVFKKTKRKK